ncbi:MAG: glycosyltransferase family 87 protein, partial [Dehalococcoidia bacterium]
LGLPCFNPPHALLVFIPLSALGLSEAAAGWVTGTIVLGLAGLLLLPRAYRTKIRASSTLFAALAIISSIPFYEGIFHGQITFLLLLSTCLLYCSLRWNNISFTVAGLILLAMKPQLVLLPIIFLLLRRRYREVVIFAVLILVLTSTVVFLTTVRIIPDYLNLLLQSTSWRNVNGVFTPTMLGWVGFVSALFGSHHFAAQQLVVRILDILTLLFVSLVLYRGSRRGYDDVGLLSLSIVGGLLASPHFYPQDLILIVPVVLVAYLLKSENRRMIVAIGVAGWFISYSYLDVLAKTHVNLATLYLLALLAWLTMDKGTHRHPDLNREDERLDSRTPNEPAVVATIES